MKKCGRCKLDLAYSKFCRDRRASDGLQGWCRSCRYAYDKKVRPDRVQVWRNAHPEKARILRSKNQRAWRAANPEHNTALRHAYRARKRKAVGTYSGLEWQNLVAFFGGVCPCCHHETKLTVDHIVPLSMGGTNDISNIQPLCKSCNSRKHTKIEDYRPEYINMSCD